MHLRRPKRAFGTELNITPLIDIVFLLIIFSLVVSQFTKLEVEKVDKAKPAKTTASAARKSVKKAPTAKKKVKKKAPTTAKKAAKKTTQKTKKAKKSSRKNSPRAKKNAVAEPRMGRQHGSRFKGRLFA